MMNSILFSYSLPTQQGHQKPYSKNLGWTPWNCIFHKYCVAKHSKIYVLIWRLTCPGQSFRFSRCASFQVLNPGDDLPHLPRIKFNEKSTRHHKRVNYDSSPWIERDERACFAGSLDSFWLCDVAMNSTKLFVLTWSSPLNHMKRAAFSEHNL